MSNFFDAIGVADMEKVHSAVIGWMLSDKCQAFNVETRSKLLQYIFNIKDQVGCFDNITSYIEWKNIDILIVTTIGGREECWLIENKIKSSQHSNQLNRYADIINCKYLLSSKRYPIFWKLNEKDQEEIVKKWKPTPRVNRFHKKEVGKHYCFLTLSDETPNSDNEWEHITYKQLCAFIGDALETSDITHDHTTIVNEYLKCITTLSNTLDVFLGAPANYSNYPNVFTDGAKTKEEKFIQDLENRSEYSEYICENGLETIFQKCFLHKIILKTNFSDYKYTISETHGTALVDFQYWTEKGYSYEGYPCSVSFGIQFQDGSFKIQLLADYEQNEDNDNLDDTEKKARKQKIASVFLKQWKVFYDDDKNQLKETWIFNASKEKKIPYFSLTKRKNSWFHEDPWFKNVNMIEPWNNALIECEKQIKILIEKSHSLGE